MSEVNVKQLVGQCNNARLTNENHLGLWPMCDLRPCISDTRPRLFELDEDDWKLIGWCEAPAKSMRDYNDAIVFEYIGDPEEREFGIYWIHCRHSFMNFSIQAKNENTEDVG